VLGLMKLNSKLHRPLVPMETAK